MRLLVLNVSLFVFIALVAMLTPSFLHKNVTTLSVLTYCIMFILTIAFLVMEIIEELTN